MIGRVMLAIGSLLPFLVAGIGSSAGLPQVGPELSAPFQEETLMPASTDPAAEQVVERISAPDATDGKVPHAGNVDDLAWQRQRGSGNPSHELALRILEAGLADGEALRAIFVDEFRRLGHHVPAPSADAPSSSNHFEPNDTMPVAYNVGDADGDGFDDVAVDAYCVIYECRYRPTGTIREIPPDVKGRGWCATPHQLYVRSGRTGTPLWDLDFGKEELNASNPDAIQKNVFCPVHFVVGTMPIAGTAWEAASKARPNATPASARQGLLVYSLAGVAGRTPPSGLAGINYELFGNPVTLVLKHEFYLLDPTTGARIWNRTDDGTVAMWDGCGLRYRICTPLGSSFPGVYGDRHNSKLVVAQNLLVNPLPIPSEDRGVRITHDKTVDALFLQGVSFEYVVAETSPAILGPGSSRSQRYYENYQPNEWLARLDPMTGKQLWRVSTFEGDQVTSVVPTARQTIPLGVPFTFFTGYRYEAPTANPWDLMYTYGYRWDVEVAANQYWRAVPCCFDQTGDGIPDVLYTTIEWNPLLRPGPDGRELIDSRLVLFDGATGSLVWEKVVAKGTPRFAFNAWDTVDAYAVHLEPVGDANADGTDDVIVHQYYLLEDYEHVLSVRSGKDGSLLWGLRSGVHKLSLPIGDADGDGGVDIAIFDWFDWDFPTHRTYALTNLTQTQITVRSGATGNPIWQTQTFTAPIDLFYQLDGAKANGVLDLDRDGVAEIVSDNPFYLPDQTVVHQLRILSGATGETAGTVRSVGTLAFPAWAGDVTADGTQDFLLISGDILDVWATLYDGATLDARWSSRISRIKGNDYLLAVPQTRVLALESEGTSHPFIAFHFHLTRGGGFIQNEGLYPQLTAFQSTGKRGWWFPSQEDAYLYQPVFGPTPATALLERVLGEQGDGTFLTYVKTHEDPLLKAVLPASLAVPTMYAAGFVLTGRIKARRARRLHGGAEW